MSTTAQTADATAFIAEAQRMTNERDVDGIRDVFAPTARWTAIIDGLIVEADGLEDIQQSWAVMCAFMESRRMYVEKQVVSSDRHTIVNEWTGTIGGHDTARGIEVWVRGDDGLVVDQRMYAFTDARPESSAAQNVRMLLAHPLTAVAFARARFRTRR